MAKRRIWANITEDDFSLFRSRCKKEKRPVPNTFADLVKQWARGLIDLTRNRDYTEDHDGRNSCTGSDKR